MTDRISEDDRYRTSTQFRLWSYTPDSLLALRTTTNQIAADRVREAVRRLREARNATPADSKDVEHISGEDIDCLTVEEELKLVAFYCRQTLQLGEHQKLPTEVKSTAVQYIKRFYITNSVMTYHPTDILKTALYFATKTENHYTRLTKFAENIGNTTPEGILASEFLLTQGLRFTFDVRHPFRALEGAVMELQALAKGNMPALPGGEVINGDHLKNMARRVKEAHGKARDYLKTSSLLTDVYFHFTPSQIMMAALLIADQEMASWYIKCKIPAGDVQSKVLATITKCAEMLQAVDPSLEPSATERKELQALAKKLKKCRNPEKMDLIGLQRAKREGEDVDDEKVVKKRKLEREKSAKEVDDLFGPEIKKM